MVEHDVEHAFAFVGKFDGVDARLGSGCGEHVAYDVDIDHALAHETLDGGLMSAAALRDDGHAVGAAEQLVDDQVLLAELEDVGVGHGQSLEQLGREVVGIVDELLHLHDAPPSCGYF